MLFNSFLTTLDSNFKRNEWKLIVDENDTQSLLFYYPHSLDHFDNHLTYIAPAVKLEFGARADRSPSKNKTIKSYLEFVIPEVFKHEIFVEINTLSIVRTFWEKVTLLHGEYHRKNDQSIQKRLFRHYYDLMMLDQYGITVEALREIDLLNVVVENKEAFFPSSWASYDTANIGTLRLYPNENFIFELKKDCQDMLPMFFGEAPLFEDVMSSIRKIEERINQH